MKCFELKAFLTQLICGSLRGDVLRDNVCHTPLLFGNQFNRSAGGDAHNGGDGEYLLGDLQQCKLIAMKNVYSLS